MSEPDVGIPFLFTVGSNNKEIATAPNTHVRGFAVTIVYLIFLASI